MNDTYRDSISEINPALNVTKNYFLMGGVGGANL